VEALPHGGKLVLVAGGGVKREVSLLNIDHRFVASDASVVSQFENKR
jgi:hypothetical protein